LGFQPSRKLLQARVFGGVGSILVILSVVPYVGFALGIVGLILILVALKYISEEVSNEGVFRYGLYSVITGILASIIATLIGLAFFLSVSMSSINPTDVINGRTMVPPVDTGPPTMGLPLPIAFMLSIIVFILVLWILVIVSAYFLRKSYNMIARSLGVGLFSTAALLYLIGAFLTIVFLVGLIIILVAAIIQAIAFFSIPERVPEKGSGEEVRA